MLVNNNTQAVSTVQQIKRPDMDPANAAASALYSGALQAAQQSVTVPAAQKELDKATDRIDEAFAVLGDATKRQAYRRATFNMVWPHQATLLVQQAKLAIYRKDVAEARDLLAAAQDLSPSPEARVLLDTLNRTS